jgi:hypothetical protein
MMIKMMVMMMMVVVGMIVMMIRGKFGGIEGGCRS